MNDYWIVTDHPGVKTSELIAECRALFKDMYVYNEEKIDEEFPAPKEMTTRRFKRSVEPDSETLGKSAKECEGIDGITLRERIILEIIYFKETGNHLDVKSATFCSGSRYSGGGVPCMCLSNDGEVGVFWYSMDGSNAKYGIRRAFPLNLESLTLIEIEGKKYRKEDAVECLKGKEIE